MKRHVEFKAFFLALALILSVSSASFAQEETAATVTGQVTDSTGAIIKGAVVVITNDTTRQERRLETNDDGQFVITPLMPGTYTLSVSAQLRADQSIADSRKKLVATLDALGTTTFTEEEVARARTAQAKRIELLLSDANRVGVALSGWAAVGAPLVLGAGSWTSGVASLATIGIRPSHF